MQLWAQASQQNSRSFFSEVELFEYESKLGTFFSVDVGMPKLSLKSEDSRSILNGYELAIVSNVSLYTGSSTGLFLRLHWRTLFSENSLNSSQQSEILSAKGFGAGLGFKLYTIEVNFDFQQLQSNLYLLGESTYLFNPDLSFYSASIGYSISLEKSTAVVIGYEYGQSSLKQSAFSNKFDIEKQTIWIKFTYHTGKSFFDFF
jgi:hypothetical protein